MKDFSENITRCNLHLHGRFSQARSHILVTTGSSDWQLAALPSIMVDYAGNSIRMLALKPFSIC